MKKFFAIGTALVMSAALLAFGACANGNEDTTGDDNGTTGGDNNTTTETSYDVYAPDGAPALALANAIQEQGDGTKFDFHIVASDTIAAQVTGEDPAADFCVLPVNVAAKLLGQGDIYQMLGTVTNGNMYFLTTGDNAVLTSENLSTLVGKTVGVVQLTNVPGLTLQVVLEKYDLDVNILGNDGEVSSTAVNLRAFDATNVTPAGGCDYYLCPEPAAMTKINGTALTANPFKAAGSLQELYGENGYPQAVMVAKTDVIESDEAAVDTMISYMEGSAEYLASADATAVVDALAPFYTEGMTPSLNAKNLTAAVIANCSVRFTAAQACKATVNAFLQELIAVNPAFTTTVADAFYYAG